MCIRDRSINGDLSYLNLDWKPVPIVPKFVDIVVNGISNRTYDLKAYSVDPVATKRRTEFVENLLNDMYASDFANKIQQGLGVNTFFNEQQNIPDDEEELQVHMQLSYKQSIEIAQEQAITNVFDLNKYDLLKRRLDYDIAVVGMASVKNSFNTAEGIKLEYIDPTNLVYSYSESPYFDDLYYVGEIKTISLVDLKKQYPYLTEEDIKQIECRGSDTRLHNKSNSAESQDKNFVNILYNGFLL